MGAILLATLGVAPERGGHVTVMTATAATHLESIWHTFSGGCAKRGEARRT